MEQQPTFRCERCNAAIDDRENVVVIALHSVRKRPQSIKCRAILFQEEFEDGVHERHFHEACLYQNASQIVSSWYDETLPPEPKLRPVLTRRR